MGGAGHGKTHTTGNPVGRPPKRYADNEIESRVKWMLEHGLSRKLIQRSGLDRPMPRLAWWVLLKQVKRNLPNILGVENGMRKADARSQEWPLENGQGDRRKGSGGAKH